MNDQDHFRIKRSEFVTEQLLCFEAALNRRCRRSRKKKRAKRLIMKLDCAHLIVLEILSSRDNTFCRYSLHKKARRVMRKKPKGFKRAWKYVTEQLQNYNDLDTVGAEP